MPLPLCLHQQKFVVESTTPSGGIPTNNQEASEIFYLYRLVLVYIRGHIAFGVSHTYKVQSPNQQVRSHIFKLLGGLAPRSPKPPPPPPALLRGIGPERPPPKRRVFLGHPAPTKNIHTDSHFGPKSPPKKTPLVGAPILHCLENAARCSHVAKGTNCIEEEWSIHQESPGLNSRVGFRCAQHDSSRWEKVV